MERWLADARELVEPAPGAPGALLALRRRGVADSRPSGGDADRRRRLLDTGDASEAAEAELRVGPDAGDAAPATAS